MYEASNNSIKAPLLSFQIILPGFGGEEVDRRGNKYQNALVVSFVDFENAFDSVFRQVLREILREYGVPDNMIR